MLAEYIKSAMQRASYKLLDDREGVFGEIIGFQGLWAIAPTLEACQAELEEALEEWIILGLKLGHSLPEIEGVTLDFTKVEVA
ncbi:MAG: type II toxin-antitoxin system HicB family antitoxin [Cyanosarcina radialis HA8281-LM2]|jgi:predicted RNase H-like HicB family nuclease|nr:type II toxin-antitoxin system HicB family antitoxin [Cyanosarcina radialis HA8281-LM2]